MFDRLHRDKKMTIILVTHLMDDVAEYADFMYILEKGHLVKSGTPQAVFQEVEWANEKKSVCQLRHPLL